MTESELEEGGTTEKKIHSTEVTAANVCRFISSFNLCYDFQSDARFKSNSTWAFKTAAVTKQFKMVKCNVYSDTNFFLFC